MVTTVKRVGQFLSDQETKIDLLSYEAIAGTIVSLLLENPNQPITIGVHGDWGAGKSSILEMIEAALSTDNEIICLKFNGWRFQGFEDAKIALIEGIVTSLLEKRPALNKAVDKVKEVWRCIDWLKVAKKAGGLALTAFTGIPNGEIIQAVTSAVDAVITNPEKLLNPENAEKTFQNLKDILKTENESKKIPAEVRAFHKAFEELLKSAEVKQLVVLIDDLDRCLPEIAIETLEAMRLFVFTARTAFVVAADEAMIEYAVRKHFPDYPETSGSQTYARNYLEKLIHVPFRIPSLGDFETRIYVLLLLTGAELGFEEPGFAKFLSACREKLKRPWEASAIDASMFNDLPGERSDNAQGAIFLSEQVAPLLARGTNGNPRQIKRFLNTLVLRKRIADARGFGGDINLPVLAKIMLAERFNTDLFEKIAFSCTGSSNGKCDELDILEKKLKAAETKEALNKAEFSVEMEPKSEIPEPSIVAEWLNSKNVCAWASIEPNLGQFDLRPYFFVAKDRKDYFGSLTALGPLEKVVEQLLKPKIVLKSLGGELARLTKDEAEKVFAGIRGKIISGDVFDKEPRGIAGIRELVAAKPDLQGKLLEFLQSLPVAKLGAWIIQGWADVFVSPEAKSRFQNQLDIWDKSGNTILKSAIDAISKLKGKN